MAQRSDASIRIEALRMGRGETQERFGKLVRVNPTAVSAWERGVYEPSSETWLRLAKLAPFPDALWFLERAGLDEQTILSAAGKIMEDRAAPPASGEIIRIPLVRRTERGFEKLDALDALPLPVTLVRNPVYTIAILVGKNSSEPALSEGDVVIVDVRADTKDLRPFMGQIVLVEFAEKAERVAMGQGWPGGLFIGRLSIKEYLGTGLTWAALLQGVDFPVGMWQYKLPPENPEVLGIPKYYDRAIREARVQAPENIRLSKGCRIVGRAIGWFKAPEKRK